MEWPFGKEKYSKPEFSDEGIKLSASIKTPESIKQEKKFPTWKQVIPDPEIISTMTALDKLTEKGYKVARYDRLSELSRMMDKVNWSEKLESYYDVVIVNTEDLFNDKEIHPYKDIVKKAKENGLDFVPASLAISIPFTVPQYINGKYNDNPDWINVAMKPIDQKVEYYGITQFIFYYSGRPERYSDGFDSLNIGNARVKGRYNYYMFNKFFFVRKKPKTNI